MTEKIILSDYTLHLGDLATEFIHSDEQFALKKIKKMRERISKQSLIPCNPIRIINTEKKLAKNVIILYSSNDTPIHAFEFNDSTKEYYKKFIKKLEQVLLKEYFDDDFLLSQQVEEMRRRVEKHLTR